MQSERDSVSRDLCLAGQRDDHCGIRHSQTARHSVCPAGGSPEFPYDEGRGFAFEPGSDHPLLVPSAGDAWPKWALADFIRATEQARDGRIAILQFHGVPDTAHNRVSSSRENFEACMKYLKLEKYQVLALRDLQEFIDPAVTPEDPFAVVEARKRQLEQDQRIQP